MSFTHSTTVTDGFHLISLSGRLMQREQGEEMMSDFSALMEQGHIRLLLDLTALEHVNSSGLNLLIGMFTKARNAGGQLAICGISDKVRKLLVMTRLDSVFNIHGSVQDALEHFND
jgi:anti-sigma B factor antagonist